MQLIGVGDVQIRDVADCFAENCSLGMVCIKGDII